MQKALVICLDGTWKTPLDDTNVTRVVRAILPYDSVGAPQIVYYDQGVGTGGGLTELVLGGALGIGLEKQIKLAYQFLSVNYNEGDRILIFGFSRGAFAARSLAALVTSLGLPSRGQLYLIPSILAAYRDGRRKGMQRLVVDELIENLGAMRPSMADRSELICPAIDFLGLWDTVGTLGIPFRGLKWIGSHRYNYHVVAINSGIRRVYQALALNEKRRIFNHTIINTKDKLSDGQIVEQRWFLGQHSSVGGGDGPDTERSSRPFLWIISKASALLHLNEEWLERWVTNLRPIATWESLYGIDQALEQLGSLTRRLRIDPTEVLDESVYEIFGGYANLPAEIRKAFPAAPAMSS